MKITRALLTISFALGMTLGSAAGAAPGATPETSVRQTIPHRVRDAGAGAPTAGSTSVQTPVITYHGGAIMQTPNVYVIWYGNWNQTNGSDNAAGQQIMRDFLFGLNNSTYYLINSSYSTAKGTPTGGISLVAETTDTGSQGTKLTDAAVQKVVTSALSGGKLPLDSNGIYLVLTSSNVSESSGFCRSYCGWHTSGTISGIDVKYAFIGNANKCLSACAAQSVGPNGNAGVDGMISVVAHELEETTTDPDPTSGWADSKGAENGDKCAWTFGANPQKAANGAYYNMTLATASGGTRNYLVQRNLDASSLCYVDYVKKTQ